MVPTGRNAPDPNARGDGDACRLDRQAPRPRRAGLVAGRRSARKADAPVQAFCAKRQANSASGLALAAVSRAWALEAVPSTTRLAMPCTMAAMRNML